MTEMLKILPRHQIDATAWDACVAISRQRILYGYSWYLDAVLPSPSWKWEGLVLTDEAERYQAVMPVPLRRKQIIGVTYEWVVHQPFFCQFLSVFSRAPTLNPEPFFQVIQQRFRYGSILNVAWQPTDSSVFDTLRVQTTLMLDLAVGYEAICQHYTRDRKVNLRRAKRADWTVTESNNLEPLLNLFRENHADTIRGGVADWAYAMLRNLMSELHQRGLATLRYAIYNEQIEAGALFAHEGNRIIYLFNAASAVGRQGNARTLLIDQMIREKAGNPVIFDFESPEKLSIREFYRSFGAIEEPFWTMRWSRLTTLERTIQRLRNRLKIL